MMAKRLFGKRKLCPALTISFANDPVSTPEEGRRHSQAVFAYGHPLCTDHTAGKLESCLILNSSVKYKCCEMLQILQIYLCKGSPYDQTATPQHPFQIFRCDLLEENFQFSFILSKLDLSRQKLMKKKE